jgi:hypothetical protein
MNIRMNKINLKKQFRKHWLFHIQDLLTKIGIERKSGNILQNIERNKKKIEDRCTQKGRYRTK